MIKRYSIVAAALLIALSSAAFGQQGIAVSVRNGTTNPAKCAPSSVNVFLHRTGAATADTFNICSAIDTWTALATVAGTVPSTRTISTTAPLGGGGDLSADRTLTCTTCATSANNLSFFSATSSAQFLALLNDETGSGLAVFNNGPTFIAPVLGTPASGVATNLTGTAAGLTAGAVTTNANLTGPITSAGNATSITSQTGTGTKFVVDTSPTIITPTIASFANATHNHQAAAGGGTLVDAAIVFTAPALGAPTATTIQTSGNVGFGAAPSGAAGTFISTSDSANEATIFQAVNTNASGTAASAVLISNADTAVVKLFAHGTNQTTSRWLHAVGGFNELLALSGNGLDIGTNNATPVTIGTGATPNITIASGGAVTLSSTLAVTGAITPSQTAGIVGTTTNNNANAGSFGEYQTGTVAANTTSLSTGTTANVGANTNITLTAGDWDCTGVVNFTFGATTSITNLTGGISTTTATLPAQDSYFDFETSAIIPTGTAVATWVVPTVRLSLSGSTNVFLVSQATFSASTLKVGGTIRCRRMR